MILLDTVAPFALSLAIGLSWGGFRPIFSRATSEATLRSPVTTLASAICVTSLGMAFNAESTGLMGIVAASGLFLGVLLEKSPVHPPKVFALSLAGALLVFHLSIMA
ncbi:hypothetical protein [Pararhizobium sp. DWP3-4]|uniref:hypothetical protein n=1 Tax=unclassified Pararhizobium TaxID=2643050 RepID=UPI003CF78F92